MGNISPCPHRSDSRRQRIDIALNIVEPRKFAGIDALRNDAVILPEILPQRRDEAAVMLLAHLAEVRQTGDFPKPRDIDLMADQGVHIGHFGQTLEHQQIYNLGRWQ